MGQESEELRADIEQRRENMSDTIDAIEDRVVPGRIIERKRQAARELGPADCVIASWIRTLGHRPGRNRGGSTQRWREPSRRQGVGRHPSSCSAPPWVHRSSPARLPSASAPSSPPCSPRPNQSAKPCKPCNRNSMPRRGMKDVGQQALETAESRRATPRRSSRTPRPSTRTRSPNKRKTRGNSSRTTPRRAVNNECLFELAAPTQERVARPEPIRRDDSVRSRSSAARSGSEHPGFELPTPRASDAAGVIHARPRAEVEQVLGGHDRGVGVARERETDELPTRPWLVDAGGRRARRRRGRVLEGTGPTTSRSWCRCRASPCR